MNNNIPEWAQGSTALQLIIQQGWEWKASACPNVELETCPKCKKSGYGHFYIECHGSSSSKQQRNGLFLCQKCGWSGNLHSLKQFLGIVNPEISSQKEWASSEKKIDPLPDIEACHNALLNDEKALEYLCLVRGFSLEIIKKQKLGLTTAYFKSTGANTRALVFPYLVNGNAVWAKFRTCPDPDDLKKIPKDFVSPHGWDAVLYNGEVLKEGLKELILVEGECDCIAALDKGIENVAAVPGANIKKADWIEQINKLGVEKVYVAYDKDKVGQKAAQVLAARIGFEKCFKIILPDFEVTTDEGETRKGKDLNEWFVNGGGTKDAFEELKKSATLFDVDGVSAATDALSEFEDELNNKGAIQKYKWPLLSNEYGPIVQFDEGDCIHILAEEKVGKALRNDCKVKTPTGWVEICNLKVGDELASIDGELSFVTGVFPQGLQPLFEITFSDGRKTITTKEHLWKVSNINKPENWRIYTTDSIRTEYTKDRTTGVLLSELFIPLISGNFGSDDNLIIDPWLLGVLIGDGSIVKKNNIGLTTTDIEISQRVSDILLNYKLSLNITGIHRKCMNNGHIEPLNKARLQFDISTIDWDGVKISEQNYVAICLEKLGLLGKRSYDKFIPYIYLEGSRHSRMELLRGLLDTDGTATKKGNVSYCTISKQLALDVQKLVRSVGGISTISPPLTKQFKYKGEMRIGQPAYIVSVRLPKREESFFVQRKLDRVKERINFPRLRITNIKEIEAGESTCISVSHPSKLFITDDFIVTHNSKFAMNMLEYMVDHYGEDGIFICLEMTRAKQARMWVSHKAGIADNLPKDEKEAVNLTQSFKESIPLLKEFTANREGDIYFCYPKYETAEDVIRIILDCIRRYGVKWIVLDNLHLLCDNTVGNKNRTQHLSELSKRLAKITKDYNVQIILVLQPNRVAEAKLTSVRNVDGASQVAKDCDSMLILNRHRTGDIDKETFDKGAFIQSNTVFGPEMLVQCALSRYSSGGSTTLYFDGATSTVYALTEGKIKAMNTKATENVGYQNQAANMNVPLNTLKEALNEDVKI